MSTRECRKCNMIQPIENFGSYIHKKTGNLYIRYICNTCFREQKQKYKKTIKPRTCIECNEVKQVKDFPNYKSLSDSDRRHNICKKCTAAITREKNKHINNKRELNGEPVLDHPNTYRNEQQRIDGHELMTALGFTFNEETGMWSKEGFKNPDGTFVRIIENKRLEKERRLKEVEELDVWSKIRYLREQGYSINQISNDIGVNYTAVHKYIQDGKEIKLRN